MAIRLIVSFSALLFLATPIGASSKDVALRGINLSGGEFAANILPGTNGTNYSYPSEEEIKAFANLHMNVIRVPFLWERLQPVLNQPLKVSELKNLDTVVKIANAKNMTIILDPHNYGAYNGNLIGSKAVPTDSFVDFWKRLADHYKNTPKVAFGLMNEPNKQSPEEWAAIAQAAIYGIRHTGAHQLVLVPGTNWDGAHSWVNEKADMSNGIALSNFQDPENNFAFEAHQYFDSNFSGTHPTCEGADKAEKGIESFTLWLENTGYKGFLGEFGVSQDPECLKALKWTIHYVNTHSEDWIGWTYWVSGKWYGNYPFNVYPPLPSKHPQLNILLNQ